MRGVGPGCWRPRGGEAAGAGPGGGWGRWEGVWGGSSSSRGAGRREAAQCQGRHATQRASRGAVQLAAPGGRPAAPAHLWLEVPDHNGVVVGTRRQLAHVRVERAAARRARRQAALTSRSATGGGGGGEGAKRRGRSGPPLPSTRTTDCRTMHAATATGAVLCGRQGRVRPPLAELQEPRLSSRTATRPPRYLVTLPVCPLKCRSSVGSSVNVMVGVCR